MNEEIRNEKSILDNKEIHSLSFEGVEKINSSLPAGLPKFSENWDELRDREYQSPGSEVKSAIGNIYKMYSVATGENKQRGGKLLLELLKVININWA